MSRRSDLRAACFDISLGVCEWPGCNDPAAEMAHLEALGMSPATKDRLDNVMAACRAHARITDLESPPGGGEPELRSALESLGVNLAFGHWRSQMRERLSVALAASRSFVDMDSSL